MCRWHAVVRCRGGGVGGRGSGSGSTDPLDRPPGYGPAIFNPTELNHDFANSIMDICRQPVFMFICM